MTIKKVFGVIILAAIMVLIAGMGTWSYLLWGIV